MIFFRLKFMTNAIQFTRDTMQFVTQF